MTWRRPPRPVPRGHLLASGVGLILLGVYVACALGGCSGGSPTAPETVQRVETAYGTVTVSGDLDSQDVRRYVERGYERVRAQGFELGAHGAYVVVTTGPVEDRGYRGQYHAEDDVIEVVEGYPSVIDHETQHRAACYQLSIPGECCRLQDHPGGFDLHCRTVGGTD